MGTRLYGGFYHAWYDERIPQVRVQWVEGLGDVLEVQEWTFDGGWVTCFADSDYPMFLEGVAPMTIEQARLLVEEFYAGTYQDPYGYLFPYQRPEEV